MTGPVTTDYPATVDAVAGQLGVPDGTKGDKERAHIAVVVPAVNAFVREIHTGDDLAPDIVQGAVMLAARITRRRNSPGGIESFGELGPQYVSRFDPDIEKLLKLGPWRKLVVG